MRYIIIISAIFLTSCCRCQCYKSQINWEFDKLSINRELNKLPTDTTWKLLKPKPYIELLNKQK